MMMRTVLLGAAAGLMTVGAAQAADLPMTKAEAVEYVKVCTEFGEGFFYIPGTDTCLKLGGEVRADYRFQSRRNFDSPTGFARDAEADWFRTEARLKFDARTATEYGTLRSYIQVNAQHDGRTGGFDFSLDKAFVQFGGFTAGFAHTFFGIYDADYGNTIFAPYFSSQSTVDLLAYTAVFGGGFSATLSVEDGHDHRNGRGNIVVTGGVVDPATGLPTGVLLGTAGYSGQSMPDIVANLRVDQAWGEAAVFGAVHERRYLTTGFADPTDVPNADYGWAVGAGVGVNIPYWAGGHIALEGTYANGASNYLGSPGTSHDAIYSELSPFDTDAGHGWSVTGEIAGSISPAFTLVAFGSYVNWSGGSVTSDVPALIPPAPVGTPATGFTTADPDFKEWVLGVNATYTLAPGLTVAGEFWYQDFNPDLGVTTGSDDNINTWNGGVRVKRVF